jgi:hypothetical protein
MANRFREDVERALLHLDDHDELTKERTWYRNGPRGSLHSRQGCYKCATWGNESLRLSAVQAAKKRCCQNCCEVYALISDTAARAYAKVSEAAKALNAAEAELAKAGTDDIGLAINHVDLTERLLGTLVENEADFVTKSAEVLQERLKALRAQARTAAETLRTGAVTWAATALSRRVVLRDETSVPGIEPTDIIVFGPNRSRTSSFEFLIGRIYLRWNRYRSEDKTKADESAIAMLDDAVLTDPKQLDFPVEMPGENVTLLTWSQTAWRDELHKRLIERFIPVWEMNYTHLESQTGIKLIGIHGDISRDESRSLLAAHPGVVRKLVRLALVPEVVATYIQATEKRWSSDIVEIVEGCDPDLLETVAALWDPQSRESEFNKLETALHAASAV